MDLDVRRQDFVVEFFGLCFHALEHVLRLLTAQHENDALNRIVILLESEFAEARRMPDGYVANIPDTDGHALIGAHHHVSDVFRVPHQADAANIVKLSALGVEAATGVGIIGRQSGSYLRNGEVVSVNACRIKQHLVLHNGAAKAGIVGHTMHRAIRSFHHPVFDRL